MSETQGIPEFKSGLSWRSVLAILYAVLVFSPAVIWINLVTFGVAPGGAISFFILLIFVEYTRLAGKPLTKQEAALIFGPSHLVILGGNYFINLIYRGYFMQSDLPKLFGLNMSDIPTWWAPPATVDTLSLRTFIHPDWLVPVALVFITYYTSIAGGLFFGALGRELFIEGERLPFPIQNINAEAILTLTERDEGKMSTFSWAAFISMIYGVFLYTVPTITNALKKPVRFLPIPWFDFNYYMQMVSPGAAFGIATDAMVLATGIMLPSSVVISMFVGSFIRFLVVNPLLIKLGWTEWATRWVPGMNVTKIFQESTLYFWLNPLIGIGFAIGIVPILLRIKLFSRIVHNMFRIKFSSKSDVQRISGEPFPISWLLVLFLIGCVGAIVVDLLLVPDFPIWALILYEIIFPLVYLLITGRSIGITGQEMGIPYLTQLTIMFSGYPKIDAWFLPLRLNPGTGWLRNFKLCQLTGTTFQSYIYTQLIAFPIAIVVGFIYVSLFWLISPIPSPMFPAPAIQWPIDIANQVLWITRPARFFHLDLLIGSFLVYGAIMAVFEFAKLPFSLVSVAVGMNSPIPIPTTMFIGVIIGKILSLMIGKEWFRSNKTTIAAGIMLGEGIAIIFGVAGALAVSSLWSRPY